MRNYADLAQPALKGKFCSRSGSHPYNISLLASVIAHEGEAKAEQWAKGLVANFARAPKGGDTDQIKAVAAGECGVTIANSYYVARLMRSTDPADRKVMESVGVIAPDQKGNGTHVNVSGGGGAFSAPPPVRFVDNGTVYSYSLEVVRGYIPTEDADGIVIRLVGGASKRYPSPMTITPSGDAAVAALLVAVTSFFHGPWA